MLAYLQDEEGAAAVKTALHSPGEGVFMNEINVGEVYYQLSRRQGSHKAEHFLNAILAQLRIKTVANDLEAVIRAAKIKARHSLSYADCFAVATAQKENAVLFTGDREFKAVESLVEIHWLS